MTWLQAAQKAGEKWGLQDDITDAYIKYVREGYNADYAAHMACYDWDVVIPQEILDYVIE
jgi:hypothetical protein